MTKDRKVYKEKLENLKKEYTEFINSLDKGLNDPMGFSIPELSMYDNHPGDVGSETFERGKDLGSKIYALQQIEKVEDALERLEKGLYGICDKCGKPIPKERLEAIPLTTMCVKCREENWEEGSHYNLKARRPIEEQVIMPPFGGESNNTFDNKLGQGIDLNEFDGEDSWQAVAKFGTSESPSDIGSGLNYNNIYYDYDEDVGIVERYEQIPVYKDEDGHFYQDFEGLDDESVPPDVHDKE
ncbi:MAG: TraR/DksA C4-type zinc finger protein [Peptococcales bacterium]|jgi:YteA family regulatory protein